MDIIEILNNFGITNPFILIFLSLSILLIVELYRLVKSIRTKNIEIVNEIILKELDTRLEEFYIPLRERFQYSKLLHDTTGKWMKDGRYRNEAVRIESEDPDALRNLVVRKILLPINEDLHQIILNKMHWKDFDDKTDYKAILQHFLLWKTFENAKENKTIKTYEASHILSFPFKEMEEQNKMCEVLLNKRENVRENIRKLKTFKNKSREKK